MSCLPALPTALMPFPADVLALLSLLEMEALTPALGIPSMVGEKSRWKAPEKLASQWCFFDAVAFMGLSSSFLSAGKNVQFLGMLAVQKPMTSSAEGESNYC